MKSGNLRPNPAAQADGAEADRLNGLLNSDPENTSHPREVLPGPGSPRLHSQAVFVLAQSNSPGTGDSEEPGPWQLTRLQTKGSILGVMAAREPRGPAEVYTASSDADVKRRILGRSWSLARQAAATDRGADEQNADLRSEAVRRLGDGRERRLWQIPEGNVAPVKNRSAGDVRRRQRDPDDRAGEEQEGSRSAQSRSATWDDGGPKTSDALVEIYGTEKDPSVRKGVVNALFLRAMRPRWSRSPTRRRRRDEEGHRAETVDDAGRLSPTA